MNKRLLTSLVVLPGLFLISASFVGAFDLPMVICSDSIQADAEYYCNIGRVFDKNNDTARWTDFRTENDGSCPKGRVKANDVIGLISCDGSIDPGPISFGNSFATSTAIPKSVLNEVRDCFFAYDPPRVINVTLPVIGCNEKEICGAMIGAINMNIVWISGAGTGKSEAPVEVLKSDGLETEWYGGDIVDEAERWQSFVNHFNLKDLDGSDAKISKKAIYFKLEKCQVEAP
jgi:hypothetical protein